MIRRCVVLTGTARFRACSTYKPTFSDHAGRVTNLDDNKGTYTSFQFHLDY